MVIGELEYDHNVFKQDQAGDEKLAIRFFRKAKQDSESSIRENRPVFMEIDYIQIVVPGDRTSTIVRPVTDSDIGRFGKQYEHWKKTNQEEMLNGTPLDAWGILNLAQIEEFRYFGVRTIEHMANLRDDICQKIMGATQLKQKATAFLEMAKADAPLKKVQEELDKRDTTIASLEEAVKQQGKLIEELQKAGAKKG